MSSQPAAATEAVFSRLCKACGLCCDGVLFHLVRLQPEDSPRALAAVGMKLKRKRGQHHFNQPCGFLGECGCSIYESRPQRCRLFECRQIQKLRAGEVAEDGAEQTISSVRRRVRRIEDLLARAGNDKVRQPLAERCARVMALPADPRWDAKLHALQQSLHGEMHDLNEVLNHQFRLTSVPLPACLAGSSSQAAGIS